MSEGSLPNLRDAVFTTALWDGGFKIADWEKHIERMKKHAECLRIPFPLDFALSLGQKMNELAVNDSLSLETTPNRLLRIELSRNGTISLETRFIDFRNEDIDAVTVAAPKWAKRVSGTKHGSWGPYRQAKHTAESKGADLAFLVDAYAIIDADRAMPIVMDEDGTAWIAAQEQGGVESITFALISEKLQSSGIPVQYGRLNERLVARAIEVVAIGSGMGACKVLSLDGEELGSNRTLTTFCQSVLEQHYQNQTTWNDVRGMDES